MAPWWIIVLSSTLALVTGGCIGSLLTAVLIAARRADQESADVPEDHVGPLP